MARVKLGSGSSAAFGIGAKIFATLFLGAFLAGGLFFGWMLIGEFSKNFATYSWASTECKILESSVAERGRSYENPYLFNTRFEYSYNGTTYISETAALNDKAFGDYNKAQSLVDRFPEGATSTCLVNPKQPDQAILIKGELVVGLFLIIPAVFILIGGGGIIMVWMAKITKPGQEEPKSRAVGRKVRPALSSKAKGKAGRVIQFWFFLVFLVVGVALTFFLFVRPMYQVQAAKSWVETDCIVESSRVRSHRSDDGTTYSVDILYRYTFNGKEYKSNRYKFMGGSSSGRSGKSEVVRKHPRGKKTVCYVNPKNPTQAVLIRNFTWDMMLGLIPSLFGIVGFFGLVHYFKSSPKRKKSTTKLRDQTQPEMSGDEPVELKPKATPLTKLIGMIFFALFWNGIVSVFLWQAIKAWQSGRGGFMEKWFLPIFLIPFVLIGLFLIVSVFHSFLALFNPRPRLRLSSNKVALGEDITLQWKVKGRIQVLENLKVSLEGKEEARYRRGTRTYTDTNVFQTMEIANLTSLNDMRMGQTQFKFPTDTMHSFDGKDNKIIWTLKVKGEIKKWPDIDDEFIVKIHPHKIPS